MRKTKIICTIGPSSEDAGTIKDLIEGGMDVARLNFSHSSHIEHARRIERLKKISEEVRMPIAIMLDTKGPEIRVGIFEGGKAELKEGDLFTLFKDGEKIGDKSGVGISYPYLARFVDKGAELLIDDGRIILIAIEKHNGDVICRVKSGGVILNRKSLNIPNVDIDQEYISKDDEKDLLLGVKMDVDFIAASFVRCEDDVIKLRGFLDENGGKEIKIISKIESGRGLRNIDSIIKVSDGIMIARGDMGVELPFDKVPEIQKKVIRKCLQSGKTVITATEMLDSMQLSKRPTRAEASDVANAVYDGSSALMLSAETASGAYPLQALRAMKAIIESTEEHLVHSLSSHHAKASLDIRNALSVASISLANEIGAKAIIVCTKSGETALRTSILHPSMPIIAICLDRKRARQLKLEYGVLPIYGEYQRRSDMIKTNAIKLALETGIVKAEDYVVLEIGSADEKSENSYAIVVDRISKES